MLEKALERDPNSMMALGDIAGADIYLKQPDKAVARIQQQIAKSPKNPEFYSLLGEVQLGTKDFNGARENGKKAMDLDPASQRAVQVYAQAAASMGNVDEAIQIWDRWAIAHPKDPAPVSMMAMLEDQKGDTAKAMVDYKKTLDLASSAGTGAKNAQALAANNLAYLMVENNQSTDMALTYAQLARNELPHSPDTADTLAWVYYHKGTFSTARSLLEDALKQNPDNAAMHYHLGMTYNMLGRKSDAEVQLKKAVSLDPNGKPGKDAAAALAKMA
jgi:predicted Zn-dependent protease